MRIGFQIEDDEYEAAVDDVFRRVVAPALAEGVNRAGERVVERLQEDVETTFDRPRQFTKNSFGMFRARPSANRDPTALVFVKRIQEQYLGLQIEGGARQAGDYATMRQGVLIPGPDARLDQYGNLPRNLTARARTDPDMAWVTFEGQDNPALIRRVPGGLEILAYVVDQVEYDPTFDFYGTVEEVAGEYLAEEVAAAMDRRLGGQDQ